MTKYFKLLLVAIIATMSFALTSCGDDNEPVNSDKLEKTIIGKWTCDYYGVLNYAFSSNGTVIIVDPEEDDDTPDECRWWCSDSTLYIDWVDETIAYHPVKISKNQIKFKIYYPDNESDQSEAEAEADGKDENGYYDILTFNRIK